MDKLKEKLHIGSSRRKSQPENDAMMGSSTTTGRDNVGTIEGTVALSLTSQTYQLSSPSPQTLPTSLARINSMPHQPS